jgi:hypothetical protein
MDVRLTAEQQQLRDAAAKLADDLGPGSVQELDDESRVSRLDKQLEATGWRSLRSDGASGVEVAIVVEEFGRRLVDTPFLGPVLADDLARHLLADVRTADARGASVAVDDRVIDARGCRRALYLSGGTVLAAGLAPGAGGADLTRRETTTIGPPQTLGEVSAEAAARWRALALVATTADLVGIARGAHSGTCDYAIIR